MSPVILNFSRPISYKGFLSEKKAHCSGIYIWGFLIKEKFIPHYVGKHESCIYSRVISHYRGIHNSTNYTVFTKDFYNNLGQFSTANDTISIKRVAQPYKYFEKDFHAYLVRYSKREIKTNSKEIVAKMFNEKRLYISYAFADKKLLSLYETAVKFALKYNTIGRSHTLQALSNPDLSLRITSTNNLLKDHFYKLDSKSLIDHENNIYKVYE
ncbi:MAG: hypothetical protein ABIR30_03630 [Chitinophagaceae bacterium]